MSGPQRVTLPEPEAAGTLRRTATSHLGLRVPDVAACAGFYCRVLGMAPHADLPDGGKRLGWGSGHHVLDLVPGDPALDHIAFEVADPGGLEALEKRLREAGNEVSSLDESFMDEAVAGPAGLVCTDPDGTTVHFHGPVRRSGEHTADPARRPIKYQHVTLATTDVARMADFYVGVAGFRISDQLADGGFAWLRSNRDHHTLAIVRTGQPGLDHYSYDLAQWEDFKTWCDRLTDEEVDVVWGPGRHGPGNNLFVFSTTPRAIMSNCRRRWKNSTTTASPTCRAGGTRCPAVSTSGAVSCRSGARPPKRTDQPNRRVPPIRRTLRTRARDPGWDPGDLAFLTVEDAMTSALLSRWPLAETPDPEQALHSINALLAPTGVRSAGPLPDHGHFLLNGFADEEFAIGFISSDLGLEAVASAERESSYIVNFGVFGELPFETGEQRLRVTRSVAAVVNPGERFALHPERRPTGNLAIRLRRQLVNRELAALLGTEPRTDPRFAFTLDLTQPDESGIRDVLSGMLAQFNSEHQLLAQPAVRRADVRKLVTSLLLAHRHTYTDSLRRATVPLRPGPLAQALEYLEEHLAEQITLGDIARAAGRSARTVDAAFRDHLGVPPMTHLRNLRLDRVRAMLRTSRETTSAIALDAGFTHLGRFAAAYRERYGELPSATRTGR